MNFLQFKFLIKLIIFSKKKTELCKSSEHSEPTEFFSKKLQTSNFGETNTFPSSSSTFKKTYN